jgi:signal transduction histidine kinase
VSDAAERPTLADLRPIDLFDDLSDEELQRWVDIATVRDVAAGGVLADKGDTSYSFKMLIEGTVQSLVVDGPRSEPAGQHVAPTWMGAIPVLTGTGLGVRLRAETECRFATVSNEEFEDLVLSQRSVHRRIMRQVRPVVSRITAVEQNRDRLASLGTMAAGLAHELNNPAAAAKRAAADLADALEVLGSTIGKFVRAGVTREQAEKLVEMHEEALAQAAGRTALDALDSADAEDELVDALGDLGVEDGWRVAEPLVAAGVDAPWLARVAELAGPATGDAVAWVAASLTARGLAAELSDSAERMSKLVGAVKSYAYMDRGEVVEADVHEGLETTLVVLAHKLKHSSIEVVRDYDRSLPRLTVRGSELNQVWTNLIDNAIDALGDSGTITIATRLDGDCAVVEVADDGPGIPPDARERVFEPFFTTKGVGSGTGLGLDTARRIVEERHRGSLAFESEPGRTAFRVRLPLAKTAR